MIENVTKDSIQEKRNMSVLVDSPQAPIGVATGALPAPMPSVVTSAVKLAVSVSGHSWTKKRPEPSWILQPLV